MGVDSKDRALITSRSWSLIALVAVFSCKEHDGSDDGLQQDSDTDTGAPTGTDSDTDMPDMPDIPAVSLDLATADRRYDGQAENDNVGRAVANAGDVDGDGLGDVVFNSIGGGVYLVRGPGAVALPDADTAWFGNHTNFSIDGGADYNGDGLDDVVLGAARAPGEPSDDFMVRVFAGEADGVLAPFDQPSVGLTYDGASSPPGSTLTYSVAWVDETLVVSNDETHDGLAPLAWLFRNLPAVGEFDADAAARIFGPSPDPVLYNPGGTKVSRAGDTDGDGVQEVLIYASERIASGSVYAAPVDLTSDLTLDATVPRILSDESDFVIGPVDGAVDVTGDGLHDVLVALLALANEVPNLALLDGPIVGGRAVSTSVAVFEGQSVGWLNLNVGAFAGDVNGDGFPDVIGGARGESNGLVDTETGGVAALFLGPHSGRLTLADADVLLNGEEMAAWAGYAVDGAGDVDGDGLDDLIVGSPMLDTTVADGGAVYLLYGSTLFP